MVLLLRYWVSWQNRVPVVRSVGIDENKEHGWRCESEVFGVVAQKVPEAIRPGDRL